MKEGDMSIQKMSEIEIVVKKELIKIVYETFMKGNDYEFPIMIINNSEGKIISQHDVKIICDDPGIKIIPIKEVVLTGTTAVMAQFCDRTKERNVVCTESIIRYDTPLEFNISIDEMSSKNRLNPKDIFKINMEPTHGENFIKKELENKLEKGKSEIEINVVYIVSAGDYSDYKIYGIYSTKEKAEYAKKLFDADEIEEWDIDDLDEWKKNRI